MASDNRLLGSGKTYSAAEVQQILENFDPIWMFHKDHPEGQVVKKQVIFDKLVEEGWVDHPGKCTLLPGLEKFYEGAEEEGEDVEEVKKTEKTKKVEKAEEVEPEAPEYRTAKIKKLFKD